MFGQFDYDLIVIGSGAGGSVGASYARKLGKTVAIVESEKVLGGECPNWACIPTKALLQAAEVYQTALSAKSFGVETSKVKVSISKLRQYRNLVVSRTTARDDEKLLAEEGIALIRGRAKFVSKDEIEVNKKRYRAKRYLVATGADTFVPPIPGIEKSGYITFKEAAEFKTLPKSIVIIGGGPIGCEFAQLYSDLGVKVTLLEAAERLLVKEEAEVGKLIESLLESRGVTVITGAKIAKIEKKMVVIGKTKIKADQLLLATGKTANLSFEPKSAGVVVENGKIRTNAFLQTSNPRIFAAGDNVGPLQFTHTAAYQSRLAVHNAFNRRKVRPGYLSIPRCVFVRPEVASVGFTESEAKKRGLKVKTGISELAGLGRANTSSSFEGFVKVVADRRGVILGGAIVAPRAGEMIHELALAIRLKATASEVADLVHAFPTYSEAVKLACANVS